LPDPARPTLLASIDVGDEAVDRELAALDPVIGLRQTNRRRFASGEVPPEVVNTLVSAAEREGAILIRSIWRTTGWLWRVWCSEQIRSRSRIRRIGPSCGPGRRPTRIGATGCGPWWCRTVDGTAGDEVPIRDFDSQGKGGLPPETRSGRDQCLLILGTTTDRPEAWLRAGEALERVWLEATRAGYVASLFSQPVEVAAVRAQLRSDLRLSMQPHMVIRVGRAPVTPASRRRHVADVLDDRTTG
jgi:hypothetical protein